MLSKKLKLFFNNYSLVTIILIILHQSSIALSIYFLTNLIENFQLGLDTKKPLLFFLFFMIFPYIPGLLSYVSLQKWINLSHQKYIINLLKYKNFSPLNSNNFEIRENFNSLASRNSFSTINSYLYFIHDLFTLVLNSIFSLLVIVTLLSKELAIGYILSSVLSFLLIILTYKKVYKYSLSTEKEYINYGSTLLKMWDNLSILNKINKLNWLDDFKKNSFNYYSISQKSTNFKQMVNFLIAFFSLVPTGFLIYQMITNNQTESIVIAAIIVNMTRIFQILSSLNSLLHSIIDYPAMNAKIDVLFSYSDHNKIVLHNIKKETIKINNLFIDSYEHVDNIIVSNLFGRYTISGKNGVGKSSLLFYIKDKFYENSIIVPVNNDNLLWNLGNINLSSGQKNTSILEKINNVDEIIILLDEWDANLDIENTNKINMMLNNLSEKKIIFEVRH